MTFLLSLQRLSARNYPVLATSLSAFLIKSSEKCVMAISGKSNCPKGLAADEHGMTRNEIPFECRDAAGRVNLNVCGFIG